MREFDVSYKDINKHRKKKKKKNKKNKKKKKKIQNSEKWIPPERL